MNRKNAIKNFFNIMEQKETEASPQFLQYLEESISKFVENESKKNADSVYMFFTGLYRISDEKGNPLVDLIDNMQSYEEKAAIFTEKHRDHYIHSVNVFILGICLYSCNNSIKKAFEEKYNEYTIKNEDERFMYIWGYSALFHDIGYPIEIAFNQATQFSQMISTIDKEGSDVKLSLTISPLTELLDLYPITWTEEDVGSLNICIFLSNEISKKLNLNKDTVRKILIEYPNRMNEDHFIDHGFFSSLIVIKSFAYSMQKAKISPNRFLKEVSTITSAILLHNFYSHVLLKELDCGPLSIESHPAGYLLILCDEIQEWNRKEYGCKKSNMIFPDNSNIHFEDTSLFINYRTTDQGIISDFAKIKKEFLHKCLKISDVFPKGIEITCSCDKSAEILLKNINKSENASVPRPMLSLIEKLAKAIHEDYNKHRLEERPNTLLEYPTWEGLPQDLKYSNMTQALDIPKKLDAIGCFIGNETNGTVVSKFTPDEITKMGKLEHERWVQERKSNGWIWGEKKDIERRISPYIVSWNNLPENIKIYDFEAVENIIQIVEMSGLKIVRHH